LGVENPLQRVNGHAEGFVFSYNILSIAVFFYLQPHPGEKPVSEDSPGGHGKLFPEII
jgi:hypothetical protein